MPEVGCQLLVLASMAFFFFFKMDDSYANKSFSFR